LSVLSLFKITLHICSVILLKQIQRAPVTVEMPEYNVNSTDAKQ